MYLISIGGIDYDPGPYTVTIPAGQTSSSFSVQIYDDNILETDEMFTLSIDRSSLPAAVEEGPGCVLRATILDNDGTYICMYVYTLHCNLCICRCMKFVFYVVGIINNHLFIK